MAPTRRPGKKKKQPKPTKRRFELLADNDEVIVICFEDEMDNCFIGRLLETTRPSEFHDTELVRATKQINQILNGIQRNNRSNGREISFIKYQSRLMLVWTKHSTIDNGDETKVAKALHLKRISTSRTSDHH